MQIGENEEIQYYAPYGRQWKRSKIFLPSGQLITICNTLYDYTALLREAAGWDWEDQAIRSAIYNVHADKIDKIRQKIENAIGYDVQRAREKCLQKQDKKDNDIGEDALVLAAQRRREKPPGPNEGEAQNTEGKRKGAESKEAVDQISLFDLL